MPELPEVETVRRGLEPVLLGRRIARVEQRRPDLRFPFPDAFVARLTGARVETFTRRAKYLLAGLDTGETLIAHLGMSGRFSIVGDRRASGEAFYFSAPPDPAHTHVALETDAGARIEYNDPRRFGFMLLADTDALALHPALKGLGPEPLGNEFNADVLAAAFARTRQPVKLALLNQQIVAGLGNIYVCEALHRSGISPFRPANRVARKRLDPLVRAIADVLREAIAAGGSTLRDYADASGAQGAFQHRFDVYDRADAPCPRAGCGGVIRRRPQGGRSTFYCAMCQR